MKRRSLGGALVGAGFGIAGAVASPSQALADSSGEDIAQARVLGMEGIRLADANDCASAIVKLDAAERLYHAPTTLDRLGECLVATGKVVAGAEALLRVAREPLAPGAPAVFVAAAERAQKALGPAQARIALLELHVEGPPPASVSITIDGSPVLSALLDSARPTDPGIREVKVSADGFQPMTVTVTLAEGEHRKLPFKLEPAPAAPVAVATPAPAPPEAAAPALPSPSAPDRTAAWVSYGVGGAGLVVGTVFGVLALSTKSTLTSACTPQTSCPGSSQSDISALATQAWVANAGFALALVGAGLGTYFFVTASSDPPKSASTASLRVTPYFAGTGGGIVASFQ